MYSQLHASLMQISVNSHFAGDDIDDGYSFRLLLSHSENKILHWID